MTSMQMTKQAQSDVGHLLLVDDDLTFCAVFQRALSRRGFSVTVVHDIEGALEEALRCRPGYAVVDLKLGEESGLHLIKPLLCVNPEMRIIVLTGYGSISTAVKAVKAGAADYLAKPVDVETLLSAFDGAEEDSVAAPDPPPMSLGRLEWEHIQRVLQAHDGNISATARCLGMHRRTLQRKLRKKPARE